LLKFTDADLIRYRKELVGFVWQNNARNLVAYLNALENVEIPMILASKRDRRERARHLLDLVGLSHRTHSRLTELSGGEQQRVAIAIALANEPTLLLADEPTGNVDSKTADRIFRVFRDVSDRLGVTVIIVTHDRRISRAVNRVVAIRDGRTSSEFIRRSANIEDISAFSDSEGMVEGVTHEELAVLDRAGRLQLPEEYLEELGLTGLKRVKVEIEDGRIVVRRPTE
jgi:ABC-type lipoprotein export system ATPase subunit